LYYKQLEYFDTDTVNFSTLATFKSTILDVDFSAFFKCFEMNLERIKLELDLRETFASFIHV